LCGAKTEKIKQFGHNNLSVYGVGKELAKLQWRSVYRQLIARNFLTIDFANFNRVMLTESCRSLLRGEIDIELRQDVERKPALRQSSKYALHEKVQQQHTELWELLRVCRTQLATEKSVPPYVVFHDSVLMQMVELCPLSKRHFSQLSGVGEKKCDQYAEIFIDVIANYMESKKNNGELSNTILETCQLFESDNNADEVASARGLSLTTVYTHASQLIRQGKLTLDQVMNLSKNDINMIESAFVDHSAMDDHAKLKPIYEALGEAFEYHVLRCVHAGFLNKL
jgi:ATP-dependent DNA helicase RecQ